MVFTSIGHFISQELLEACHEKMDGNVVVKRFCNTYG